MTPFRIPANSPAAHLPFPAKLEFSIGRSHRPDAGIGLSVAAAAVLLWLMLSFN